MRLPQRLTIRFKILIVTATLLLIFALTNFFSIRLSKGVVNELDTITDYFMLLSAIASKIDVETFELELNLRRLIQESPLEPARLATIVSILLLVIGLPLAHWLVFSRRRWSFLIESVVSLPLVLPPTVLGFYLLMAMGSRSPLGRWWIETTHLVNPASDEGETP